MAERLNISTNAKRQVIDITDMVDGKITISRGAVNIFAHHTTCAISVADMDPGTDTDYLKALEKIIPSISFNHPHDPKHMPDHILSALIGPSLTVPIEANRMQLGTWQRIVLFEFDGPRQRKLSIVNLAS